jgi:hypothetical protein
VLYFLSSILPACGECANIALKMKKGRDQLRAALQWEAATERGRNTLRLPPVGVPEATAAEQAEALRLCHVALIALEDAYSAGSRPDDPDDAAIQTTGPARLDDGALAVVSRSRYGRQG